MKDPIKDLDIYSELKKVLKDSKLTVFFDCLKNFMALDQDSFSALSSAMGFKSLACYLISNGSASLVLSAKDVRKKKHHSGKGGKKRVPAVRKLSIQAEKSQQEWPAVVGMNFSHYIVDHIPRGSVLPVGWVDSRHLGTSKNLWPNGCRLYFAEQELQQAKIFFVGIRKENKILTRLALDGCLDAVSRRISQWLDNGALRHFVSEDAFHEHLRQLNVDLQLLLDHEMRNPLTVVQGYANMLAQGDIRPDEAIPMYQAMCEEAERAIKAVDKLSLTMSTEFDQKFQQAETLPVEIASLASRVYMDLKAEMEIPESLQVTIMQGHERIYVQGVRHMLHRAIYEVMANAVQHSSATQISIKYGVNEGFAYLDIVDNGRGIAPTAHHLVFQRFYQDGNSLKERIGTRGLGLGLYLARHIIEEHGGQLLLVPHDGVKGATFRFVWPLASAESEDPTTHLKKTA